MPVVDTLVTRYTLDASDYKAGAASVAQSTGKVSAALAQVGGKALPLVTVAIAAAGAAWAKFLQTSSTTAMDFESQTKALSLYETAGWKTADMLKYLREVAKLPGLGNLEAMQSAVRLLAGGFDFELSVRSMMAFGNALASAGKGKEDLDGVIMALTQIAAKGKVSAEEINQIAERVPQIREAMRTAFGTADTEQLQKMGIDSQTFILGVVGALEMLPRAASTAKNEISNLGDVGAMAMAKIGQPINESIMPGLQQVGQFMEYLSSIKVFDAIGSSLADLFGLNGLGGKESPIVKLMAFSIAWAEQYLIVMNNVKEMVLGAISSISGAIGKLLDALPFGGLFKDSASKLLSIAASPFKGLFGEEDFLGNVMSRYNQLVSGFGSFTPKEAKKLTGGSIKGGSTPGQPQNAAPEPQTELERQTALLGAIERNTNPSRNSILGGGNLAAMGVTPVELGGIRRGRSKIDQVAQLLREIVSEESARSGASFLRTANPFIGSR